MPDYSLYYISIPFVPYDWKLYQAISVPL